MAGVLDDCHVLLRPAAQLGVRQDCPHPGQAAGGARGRRDLRVDGCCGADEDGPGAREIRQFCHRRKSRIWSSRARVSAVSMLRASSVAEPLTVFTSIVTRAAFALSHDLSELISATARPPDPAAATTM